MFEYKKNNYNMICINKKINIIKCLNLKKIIII